MVYTNMITQTWTTSGFLVKSPSQTNTMKRNIAFILLLFLFQGIAAQKQKPKFTSINQAGVTWGGSGQTLQLQSINGIFYKTFSAGVGVGLDYYWQRTIPLFIDLRKD